MPIPNVAINEGAISGQTAAQVEGEQARTQALQSETAAFQKQQQDQQAITQLMSDPKYKAGNNYDFKAMHNDLMAAPVNPELKMNIANAIKPSVQSQEMADIMKQFPNDRAKQAMGIIGCQNLGLPFYNEYQKSVAPMDAITKQNIATKIKTLMAGGKSYDQALTYVSGDLNTVGIQAPHPMPGATPEDVQAMARDFFNILEPKEQLTAENEQAQRTETAKYHNEEISEREKALAIEKQKLGIEHTKQVTEKQDKDTEKQSAAMTKALDPTALSRGAFAIRQQVVDRAERLQTLHNTVQEFQNGNYDKRQIEELAIGMNSLLSGSNTGAQQQVENLVPKSIWSDAAKLAEWISNNPTGTKQQAFVKRMSQTVENEKSTSENQIKKTQYQRLAQFDDFAKSNPSQYNDIMNSFGLDTQEYSNWKKSGYKPLQTVSEKQAESTKTDIESKLIAEARKGKKKAIDYLNKAGIKWMK
jgi:hypothetical protein